MPGNVELVDGTQLEAAERAPSHVVEVGETPTLNDRALKNIRARTAAIRRNIRDDKIASLKLKYAAIWGKRGTAKKIASLETEDSNPTSVRMVQRYFKLKT